MKDDKCPFCGHNNYEIAVEDTSLCTFAYVECLKCKARGPLLIWPKMCEWDNAIKAAVATWKDDTWGEDSCPNCGWDTNNGDPESDQVVYGEKVYNHDRAMQSDGNPYDWEETWTCQRCGIEFTIVVMGG